MRGGDDEAFDLRRARSEQVPIVSGRQAHVCSQGHAEAITGREAVFGAQDDVAHARGIPRLLKCRRVFAVGELVDTGRVGISSGREPIDGRRRQSLDLDADERNRRPDVEMVGDSISECEGGDVGLNLQEVLRDDDVPFEEGAQATARRRQILMPEDDLDVSIGQIELVDPVKREMAEVQAEVELSFSDRVGAFRVDRPEAVRGAREGPRAQGRSDR